MSQKIYGVDPQEEITPLKVRDALVECFRQAHCEDSGVDASEKEVNAQYCCELVKKAFAEAKVDFGHPTKEGIQKAMGNLAEFAKKFRDPGIIEKHKSEIMKLVNKLK